MNIKLKARLSAYSKVDAIYASVPKVSKEDIDKLFEGTNSIVTKDDIDTLFETDFKESVISRDQIDTLFENNSSEKITTVSFDAIDSLFKWG